MKKLPLILVGLICLQGAQAAPLEERVKKLERMLNSGTLMELLSKVEQLQRDVRNMRGELEEQRHSITQMKRRQRDLYLDIDKRMQALEAAPAAPSVAPVVTTPPVSAPGAAIMVSPPAPATPVPSTVATAVDSNTSSDPNVDPAAEQKEYQLAFNLLKEARFDKAEQAFKGFLKKFPDGSYAGNAQYWLGETYYVTRQYKLALSEFERVLSNYPDSPKRSHAMLKMGYIQHELGDLDQAIATLTRVQEDYPKESAARLARERLARIKRESQTTP